jgi:hypothetical protein
VLGYEFPKFTLPEKWKFVSLGKQLGPQEWSNDLIKYFNDFDEEYFINFIDDTLLTRKVDHKKILEFINLIFSDKNIDKIFLHGSLTVASHFNMGCRYEETEMENSIVKISNDSNYRTSIQSAIWKTSFFKKCLRPNMNPWDFELQTEKYTENIILSTKDNHPMMISHLFRKGYVFQPDWMNGVFDDSKLDEEDVQVFKKYIKTI